MNNIAILCSGGGDTSREVNMANAMFIVSKIHQFKPSSKQFAQNIFYHRKKYYV